MVALRLIRARLEVFPCQFCLAFELPVLVIINRVPNHRCINITRILTISRVVLQCLLKPTLWILRSIFLAYGSVMSEGGAIVGLRGEGAGCVHVVVHHAGVLEGDVVVHRPTVVATALVLVLACVLIFLKDRLTRGHELIVFILWTQV